ncbi:MAG: penicillin-binding transpeptidase domain-containing protein [Acidimicrobiales bacterium]
MGDLFLRLAREISRTGQLTKVSEIGAAFESIQYGPFAEVPVARDITAELQLYLAEHSFEFPGVNTTVVTVREYPYGELAAHLLGSVGALSEEEAVEVEGKPKQYQPNDEIGKSGIELFYEDQLRGTPGFKTIEVDKFSNVLRVLPGEVKPQAGSDIRLTIDIDIQNIAEQELKRGLELARAEPPELDEDTNQEIVFRAPAGAVVLLDPRDGSVRAMASFPTFDPEEFVNGISQDEFAELTDPDNDLPLLNRAIQGEYAPGSTFKTFTTYAALDTGLIGSRGLLEARSIYTDTGSYRIPGCLDSTCVFINAGAAALGDVDLRLALTLSSDVYFYNLAANFDRLQFDRDSVQQAAVLFGYGSGTGITLPAESIGYIPTPKNRRDRSEENPDAFPFPNWTTGDTLNTSIGQGDVLATPLQIANAYAVIANGGTLYAPNIGQAVLDPISGDPELEFGARVIRELYFPPLIADPIHEGLAGVPIYNDGKRKGTATKTFADLAFPFSTWPVAGKTGTSEKQGEGRLVADTAVFVAYGPLPNPEYVGVALLEEAGFGGDRAAPVIAKIFKAIANGTVEEVLTEAEQSARDAAAAAAFEAAGGVEEEATPGGDG